MKKIRVSAVTFFVFCFFIIGIKLFPANPKPDETIVLPSTYGWVSNDTINIVIRAWIFELEEDSIMRKNFIELLNNNFKNCTEEEKEIFKSRFKYFLADNERDKNISIRILNKEFLLPATTPNGHTHSVIKISNTKLLSNTSINGVFTTLSDEPFTGTFKIIGEKGYSIISDIDDTIKVSNVINKEELIKNSFLRKFTPVSRMADLYRKLGKKGAVFHYISGSPWQLYPAIETFLREEKFPEGSVELKFIRLKDKSLINFIAADQYKYKVNSIKTIIDRFPMRSFILIGDSGEKDPEIYAEIANQYKDSIKYIFIRDVGLIDENSPRRKAVIEKAGKVKLIIFKDADELNSYIVKI